MFLFRVSDGLPMGNVHDENHHGSSLGGAFSGGQGSEQGGAFSGLQGSNQGGDFSGGQGSEQAGDFSGGQGVWTIKSQESFS